MAKILTSSDCSLCVEFGNAISEEINRQVRSFTVAAEAANIEGVTELVPTYRSVTVHYRPEVIGYARLYEKLSRILSGLTEAEIPPAGEIRVPVLYGGKHGPDLENVAKLHDMTPEEVVRLHTAPIYLNYMLGFLPGFCYLGGLDERLHTPRLPWASPVPRRASILSTPPAAGSSSGRRPSGSTIQNGRRPFWWTPA